MKLVIHPPIDAPRLNKVTAAAEGMQVVNSVDEEAAVGAIAEADAFFGKLTPALLASARRLRWVQAPTASLEHYVFPALVGHPCTLTNMRGLYSDVIADHVFGYILAFARNLHIYLRQQASHLWEPVGGERVRPDVTTGPGVVSAIDRAHLHLSDCTVGVVGFGGIGREIGRRARAFGMHVIAVDPVVKANDVAEVWTLEQLDRLLAQSDFVVVAAPHTPETAGMFGRRQFQRMKPTAYFVNVGRGVIAKLAELTASLEAGEIAGAALDVFEVEPLPPEHALWKMTNVIITPHVAASSVRIAERHLTVLLNNIRRFAAGQPLENVVDKAKWF